MSDAKEEYTNAVNENKNAAAHDEKTAEQLRKGYERKQRYGSSWDIVDINEVIAEVAPGSKPVIEKGKIIYYSLDGKKAVVADPSGYLRIQDLSKIAKKRQYLDRHGNDVHNIRDANGKLHGRSRDEFQRVTHYIIKKKKGNS